MTDIAALIQDLTHLEEGMIGPPYHHDEDAKIVRRAIEALSVPSPKEIAALLNHLDRCLAIVSGGESHHEYVRAQITQAADALRLMAQEVERLKEFAEAEAARYLAKCNEIAQARTRIRELEAARATIRAEAIKECAAEADRWGDPQIRDAILALSTAADPA